MSAAFPECAKLLSRCFFASPSHPPPSDAGTHYERMTELKSLFRPKIGLIGPQALRHRRLASQQLILVWINILQSRGLNRASKSVVFNSGQKMALRAFYFTRILTKALTYYYIIRSQHHLLDAIESNRFVGTIVLNLFGNIVHCTVENNVVSIRVNRPGV